MSKSETRVGGGNKVLRAINRTLFMLYGMVLALSAGWMLVSAGGAGNSLATSGLVIGVLVGAWLARAFR